jgi:hypothetical protein
MSIEKSMDTHPLFRKVPPWSLILELLPTLGLPTDFPTSFTKGDIRVDNSDELAALLYPYYKPCKAQQFLDKQMDAVGWVTVLRHCFLPHGYMITRQETSRNKKKTILYTVERASSILKQAVAIDFS